MRFCHNDETGLAPGSALERDCYLVVNSLVQQRLRRRSFSAREESAKLHGGAHLLADAGHLMSQHEPQGWLCRERRSHPTRTAAPATNIDPPAASAPAPSGAKGRASATAHPGVQQASESFMKDCYRQTRPLQIMNYDDDEAGEDPIDTGSAAYIKVQRQQILSDEERLTVDSRLKDMLHTDVDPANDTMHYHEVIRCVLHLGSVWQVEATSHLFSGTSVECGSLCRLFPMRMLPIRLFPAQDVPNSCLAHQVGGHLPEQERC